jgi:hypothetical protein
LRNTPIFVFNAYSVICSAGHGFYSFQRGAATLTRMTRFRTTNV